MAYYTNKKASALGIGPKRVSERKSESEPAVFANVPSRTVAPGETFNAEGYEIPKAWLDAGYFVPASKEDEAAAADRDKLQASGAPVADPANPLNTQGDVPPAPAPGDQKPQPEQEHASRKKAPNP